MVGLLNNKNTAEQLIRKKLEVVGSYYKCYVV